MDTQHEVTNKRSRSARRLRHEAKSDIFIKEKGRLEDIRIGLGLRPSQISELLKVHPSAWIRWTRSGQAPPHVYQALEWYLELLRWRGQKHPLTETQAMKAINQEDPQIYVQNTPHGPSKNHGFLAFLNRHQSWILVVSIIFQLLMAGFIVLYVYSSNGPGGR
jgi:hypothetical protein